ncbi:hypothetical protein IWX83_002790 [Flavobacterium sp. CG_9.1]|nr:hypothetical protein [Flavobacterium sp. CG_9.1]
MHFWLDEFVFYMENSLQAKNTRRDVFGDDYLNGLENFRNPIAVF